MPQQRYLGGGLTPRVVTGEPLAHEMRLVLFPKLTKEIPRLCRGGSKRLTFPAVAPQAPIDETASVSRQAHEHRFIDGRPWERLSQRAESAKCYAALIP